MTMMTEEHIEDRHECDTCDHFEEHGAPVGEWKRVNGKNKFVITAYIAGGHCPYNRAYSFNCELWDRRTNESKGKG